MHSDPTYNVRYERGLQIQTLTGGPYSFISRLRISLLNPDLSLYQLHGRNFSGTLVVAGPSDRVALLR